MAHIEMEKFPVVGASDYLFTVNLNISPTITDTMIQTIRDSGDRRWADVGAASQAFQTDWNMEEEPGFVELGKEITSIIDYLPNIQGTRGLLNAPTEISTMCGLLYKKDDYCNVHDHWPATWSGVFYLNIPTDYAGTLFFPELEHNIEPVTGQLVIFSGTTKHGVKTIKSNGERLAVAFNYKTTNNHQ